MHLAFVSIIFVLTTKVIEPVLGITIIFFSMRLVSIYQYWKSGAFLGEQFRGVLGYLFYFPQLLTGPYIAYGQWAKSRLSFDRDKLAPGVLRFIVNFNGLLFSAILLPYIFSVEQLGLGYYLFFDYLCFLFLYAQFSFVTNMVNSVSFVLGLPVQENFLRPLLSTSVGEFWNRWHISLRYFLNDTIHAPLLYTLVKKRIKPKVAYSIVTIATFLTLGIWHSFSLAYFFFGVYFACVVLVEKLYFDHFFSRARKSFILKCTCIIYAQLVHLIGFSFVSDAIYSYILIGA